MKSNLTSSQEQLLDDLASSEKIRAVIVLKGDLFHAAVGSGKMTRNEWQSIVKDLERLTEQTEHIRP